MQEDGADFHEELFEEGESGVENTSELETVCLDLGLVFDTEEVVLVDEVISESGEEVETVESDLKETGVGERGGRQDFEMRYKLDLQYGEEVSQNQFLTHTELEGGLEKSQKVIENV